jgi:predicted permease
LQQLSGLFGFALEITAPIYFWLFLGVIVYRLGRIPAPFVQQLSLFVFRTGLPVVLFFGAVQVDYRQIASATYVLAGFLSTLVMIGLGLAWAGLRGMSAEDGAIFTQGAYRANLNVMGIALCAQAYGAEGLALAALPVALLTIMFNIVAVVLLGRTYSVANSPLHWLGEIIRNPLIVGIALGAGVSIAGLELPFAVSNAGAWFSMGLLPLALMCIGASLEFRSLRNTGWLTLETSLWKLLVAPGVAVAIGLAMGVHSAELGVLFLLLASPVATTSYIMVMAAGGNGGLAANIVVLSTLLSTVSMTLGLAILQWSGLV